MTAKIIVVGGIPGTGKTTISKLLSEALKAPCFNIDQLEASILRRGIADRNSLNSVGYELLAEIAETEITAGCSVILDSVASKKRVSEFWNKLISHGVCYIECVCSNEEIHRQRIENRVRNIPGWYELSWNDVLHAKQIYQPFSKDRLILDSADDLNQNLDKAIKYVTQDCQVTRRLL